MQKWFGMPLFITFKAVEQLKKIEHLAKENFD
jgi:hypothetical protein